MNITARVAARFAAALGLGKTYNTENLRIHRYSDYLEITDLTNAGKRGKLVGILRFGPKMGGLVGLGSSEVRKQNWLGRHSEEVVQKRTFDEVMAYAKQVVAEDPNAAFSDLIAVRGVEVEPSGVKFSIKTDTGLKIEASPQSFRVLNRQPLSHPKTGVPMNTFQDTNYWPDKKKDAALFYAWLKTNLSKVNNMTLDDLKGLWGSLGVRYDSH